MGNVKYFKVGASVAAWLIWGRSKVQVYPNRFGYQMSPIPMGLSARYRNRSSSRHKKSNSGFECSTCLGHGTGALYLSLVRAFSNPQNREQDKEATVYVGNLDERVTDNLVWELMLQAGRIVNVHLPKDRVTQTHQGYGFVEFISEEDAEYAAKVMNQVRLFGKPIRVNKASADKQRTIEVGAELFVGNLDPMVTEQTLYDTFSRFGGLVTVPKVSSTPCDFVVED